MHTDWLRALIAFGGSLLAALLIGQPFLNGLRRLRLGQHIREEGPAFRTLGDAHLDNSAGFLSVDDFVLVENLSSSGTEDA